MVLKEEQKDLERAEKNSLVDNLSEFVIHEEDKEVDSDEEDRMIRKKNEVNGNVVSNAWDLPENKGGKDLDETIEMKSLDRGKKGGSGK